MAHHARLSWCRVHALCWRTSNPTTNQMAGLEKLQAVVRVTRIVYSLRLLLLCSTELLQMKLYILPDKETHCDVLCHQWFGNGIPGQHTGPRRCHRTAGVEHATKGSNWWLPARPGWPDHQPGRPTAGSHWWLNDCLKLRTEPKAPGWWSLMATKGHQSYALAHGRRQPWDMSASLRRSGEDAGAGSSDGGTSAVALRRSHRSDRRSAIGCSAVAPHDLGLISHADMPAVRSDDRYLSAVRPISPPGPQPVPSPLSHFPACSF